MRVFEYEVSPMVDGLPRVTLGDIERAIADVSFCRLKDSKGNPTTTTHCTITLDNGFTVTGESACVVKERFNAAMGESIALENAKAEVWKLLGYELCTKLNNTGETDAKSND